jgi:hypothetical protein
VTFFTKEAIPPQDIGARCREPGNPPAAGLLGLARPEASPRTGVRIAAEPS